ncbi:LacI family DNA-binding transcriptional regulator [Pseudomarimonas salicorniae]|uniref:LacI family DNA-binding transcriptional regulator n=1 Tax=Pseudomarimonas salicorniae TaxID=2933270 RepID=A0ABT0GDS2_9GAMM|nr:LacI family DNA-binding transcriptional regulator [Lysobacter sp. CAU 1642]MCK7592706.1 LacI family DNA-binding transcriptional regulator [Lysobacter sp. CAU 1642]
MKGKPTSFDIAYQAGVSQSTVSRALRGSPLVSAETRKRIQAIAKQLNYKVDKNASNLRRQHSVTLALLLFEDATSDAALVNPFFLSMLGSITRACAREGYDLLISFQQLSDDWHADFQDSHKADGLILLGYGDFEVARHKLEKLVEQGTQFVYWGAVEPGQPGISVGCDNVQGGRAVTEHLLSLGRRRIAFVGDASPHCPEFFDRYRGHCEALRAAGVPVVPALQVEAMDSSEKLGHAAVRMLQERGQKFDAVFAASDLLAIGAMRALEESGLRVPEDVAVVGFDDIPVAAFASPPLTTVQQDTRAAGEVLVQRLLQLIRGEPSESTMLPARVIVRRSCGQPGDTDATRMAQLRRAS